MAIDYRNIILQGDALIADINACSLPRGKFALWWLGQHSFIVKFGDVVIYIDPFLSPLEGRLAPPLLSPSQATNASLIVGTHDHADHIDRPLWPALAKASPMAKFIVPQCILDRGLGGALGIAADRFVGMDEGQTIADCESRIADLKQRRSSKARRASNPRSAIRNPQSQVRITAIASAHEFLDRDPVSLRHPYLGFVYEFGATTRGGEFKPAATLYHPGDTVWYEGLQTKLKKWKFDAMLLPINGRDALRLRNNIIGNMTYQEAADLCGPLSPGLVIPTHYDMFAMNPGDPDAFRDYVAVKYPRVRTHRCRYGERVIVTGGSGRA